MVYALTEYEFLVPQACNLIRKETLALVFSCEFSKISKSTFFGGAPPGDCFYAGKFHRKHARRSALTAYEFLVIVVITTEE